MRRCCPYSARHAEQHADRDEAQECVDEVEWPREIGQRVRQHVDAAARVHVRRGDAIAADEMRGRVHQRREDDGEPRARLARDGKLHGATKKGLFDERDGEAGDDGADESASPTASALSGSPTSSRMSSSNIVMSAGIIEHRAEQQRLEHFGDEFSGRQAKSQAMSVGHLELAHRDHESDRQQPACRRGWRCDGTWGCRARGHHQPGRIAQ